MRIILTSLGKEEIRKNNIRSNSVGNITKDKILFNLNNNKNKDNSNNIINNNIILNKIKFKKTKLYEEKTKFKNQLINKDNKTVKNTLLSPKIKYNNKYKSNILTPKYKIIYIKKKYLQIPPEIEMKFSKDIIETKLKNFNLNLSNNNINNKDISSLSEDNNNINNLNYNSNEEITYRSFNDITLPIIKLKKFLPIKDIINNNIKYKIKKKILNKEINENETSLIKYLKQDKNITLYFMEKIYKANNNKISHINKVCEHFFIHEEKNNILKNKIKNKIELRKIKKLGDYKENLKNVSYGLKNYNNICKSLIGKKESLKEAKDFFLKNKFYKFKYNQNK